MKLRHLLLLPLFACCIIAPAQNSSVKIGWFNYDSLLRALPGYSEALDSVKQEEEMLEQSLVSNRAELADERYRYDSLHHEWHPVLQGTKAEYIRFLESFIKDTEGRLAKTKQSGDSLLASYPLRLTEAAKKIALKNGCSAVVNAHATEEMVTWSAPNTTFINLTAEVIAELNFPEKK